MAGRVVGEGCNEFVLCVNNSEIGINAGRDSECPSSFVHSSEL